MFKEKETINFKDNLEYYFHILKPYSKSIILILILIFIYTSIEVGQYYLLKILVDNSNLFLSNTITTSEFVNLIFILAIIYGLAVIISGLLKYYRMIFLNKLETELMFDAKADIFNHLTRLSHSFHTTNRTGSIISKMTRIGRGVEFLTDFITYNGAPLIIKITISFIIIAFFDIFSAIIILLICIFFIGFSLFFLKKQQQSNIERNLSEDFEKSFISDVFSNIETIKYFGKENKMNNEFKNYSRTTVKKLRDFWDHYAIMDFGFIIILGIGMIFLMYFSLTKLIAGELSVGSLVFIYTSYIGLIMPLFEFMWGIRRSYEAMSDIQEVVKYKKINPEIKDIKNAKPIEIKKGSIEFDNVEFKYDRQTIIKNFNLKIKPKEKIAFVGHSGAGKTTLIKLIYRLYDTTKGKIIIDKQDIKNVQQESLRSELSIVPQECILFNDTIYNNVLFSRPKATKKEVIKALKTAQLYNFVMSLPQKENTIVGERGIKLSGGEKQRLSIARAVLANKKILILDEATSALDSKTEREIQKGLFNLMKGKTSIIIAHRLSTIMKADKIIVIEKGKISQIGTHSELIKKKGVYNMLWELQKINEIHK